MPRGCQSLRGRYSHHEQIEEIEKKKLPKCETKSGTTPLSPGLSCVSFSCSLQGDDKSVGSVGQKKETPRAARLRRRNEKKRLRELKRLGIESDEKKEKKERRKKKCITKKAKMEKVREPKSKEPKMMAAAVDEPDMFEMLEVDSVDLMERAKENRDDHHTKDYEDDDLIVRRGQPFVLELDLSRPFNPSTDKLHLELKIGPMPKVAKGTHIIISLVDKLQDGQWGAEILDQTDDRMKLSVNSSPTSVIGCYRLSVVTSGIKAEALSTYKSPDNIYMLFNPWCKEDAVYMDDEEKKKEYVLNDTGRLYFGTKSQIGSNPWNFGQFSEEILPICLFILEKSGTTPAGWGNPVNVVRIVSAMVNAPNDGGVIEGNWSGDYSGGTSPTAWNGSVEILNKYYDGEGDPVLYGQCWVFSGVVTTVLRCLGIPTRSVTNFSSAHDTDVSMTTDVYLDEEFNPIEDLNDDSIWNFHVWNECWMARPALPIGFGGWQVVDATPQETSQGIYCCGPTPVASVLNGHVYMPVDGPFVFAEVNSDKIYWQKKPDGTFVQVFNEKHTVGHHISTKAVGSDERNDITHLYKHPEGSDPERTAVQTASRFGSKPEAYKAQTAEDVSVQVTMEGEGPMMGEDAVLNIKFTTVSNEKRTVSIHGRVSVIYYTGVLKATVSKENRKCEVKPKKDNILKWSVPFKTYKDELMDQAALTLTVTGRVNETEQILATQFKFRCRSPDLVIEPIGKAVVGQEMSVKISFTNPLEVTLKSVTLRVEGMGLQNIRKINIGDIGGQASFSQIEKIVPSRAGLRKLLASLECKELPQINGVVDIVVEVNMI